MNNAGGGAGDTSGAPTGGGVPPGFQQNPYYLGNAQQSQYNDQHQQQFRNKQYSGGQQEGGRFERSGPPSIVTMHTSPPVMDQDGAPSYNPNYGNYPQYGNQGGPPYGDRNFNGPPHQMAARSHSNFSESSSSTLNIASGGPPDASGLSGPPLMTAGPHGPMMYPQQGGPPMGPPYGLPQMQQMQQGGGPPYMFHPAAAAAMANQQMMQGGQMAQQQGGPQGMQHPQGIPMQPQQGGGPMGGGPPQSSSPPHQGMMMVQMGQPGAPMHPGQTVYYQPHPMMAPRGAQVGTGPEGYVQFTYPNPHAAMVVAQQQQQQQQGGFIPGRGALMQQQRSMNSPAPSDVTDGQSVHGGPSIGMWNGPPDQQSQHSSPPGSIHPMQPMQPGMMAMQPHQMMTASYPGAGGVPFAGPGGPRMVPAMMGVPPYTPQQMQQMAMNHAALMQHQQQQGMQQMSHPQMQQQYNAGGFSQQTQPQGYWQAPSGPGQGGRGGFRGGRGGRGGGYGGNRPNSRQQYNSRNNSITSGGRGRDMEEDSKCTTPNEDDIHDVSQQMDASLRIGDQSMEGGQGSHHTMPHKQLLELADQKSVSPPAEPHPSEEEEVVPQESQQEGGAAAAATPVPTTPRAEPRKELLEMKKTPKHQTDKGSSQSIPVDPVPPHGSAAPAGRKWSEVAAKMECVYCKGKQLPVEEYSTHKLRDANNVPSCPLFRKEGCKHCHKKGDEAHDAFFCEKRLHAQQAHAEHTPAPAAGHAAHPTHAPHGDREYRGGQKRGGGGYRGGRGGGGGHGGERKYENRRGQ